MNATVKRDIEWECQQVDAIHQLSRCAPVRGSRRALFAGRGLVPASGTDTRSHRNSRCLEGPPEPSDLVIRDVISNIMIEPVANLEQIKCLTLILAGTRDGIVPRETGHLLRARLPQSHLAYVYDAAHNIETDQPALYERIVGDFLAWGEGFIVKHAVASKP